MLSTSVKDRKEIWHSKKLHGPFCRALQGSEVDFLASASELRFSNIFGKTEGFACAFILTNNYRRFDTKDGTVDIIMSGMSQSTDILTCVYVTAKVINVDIIHIIQLLFIMSTQFG